ncbi:MAG: twin-arginine translocation signal domain-containing protein [Bacteroidales bacterium]
MKSNAENSRRDFLKKIIGATALASVGPLIDPSDLMHLRQ